MRQVNQREAILRMSKSENITLTELADNLGVRLSSFRVTIEKNRLSFLQFCKIYKYIYGLEYESGNTFFDMMRGAYNLSLRDFIDTIKEDDQVLIVTLYKKTRIQIVNPKVV